MLQGGVSNVWQRQQEGVVGLVQEITLVKMALTFTGNSSGLFPVIFPCHLGTHQPQCLLPQAVMSYIPFPGLYFEKNSSCLFLLPAGCSRASL